MVTVTGISLDLWRTLIVSNPAFKPARDEMLRQALAPQVSGDSFRAALRVADRAADEASVASGRDWDFGGSSQMRV
jgi:putative hydrolase of the HAD superfamily